MMDGLDEVTRNDNGLATCARLFRFMSAMVKAFPAPYWSVGETAAWVRQTSHGDAKALLN